MRNRVLVGDIMLNIGKPLTRMLACIGVQTVVCRNTYSELKQAVLDEEPDVLVFFGIDEAHLIDEFISFVKENSPHTKQIVLFFSLLLEYHIEQKYGNSIRTFIMPDYEDYIVHAVIEALLEEDNDSLILDVIDFMSAMGFSKKIAGFFYVAIAIEEGCRDPELLKNVTRRLYPRIADRVNTSSENVERSIRHFIHSPRNKEGSFEKIRCSVNSTNRKVIRSMYKSFNERKGNSFS